jgi:hypothetical protein
MKKLLGSTALVVAAGFVATVAHAATAHWSTNATLRVADLSIETPTDSSTRAYVRFNTPSLGFNHQCTGPDGLSGWWQLGGNTAGIEFHTQLLAAKLAERPVRIMWTDGGINHVSGTSQISCAGGGNNVGFPVVRGLMLQ